MTLAVLILEDEAEVRDALERDCDEFWDTLRPVSYTHLTLPTICSV